MFNQGIVYFIINIIMMICIRDQQKKLYVYLIQNTDYIVDHIIKK